MKDWLTGYFSLFIYLMTQAGVCTEETWERWYDSLRWRWHEVVLRVFKLVMDVWDWDVIISNSQMLILDSLQSTTLRNVTRKWGCNRNSVILSVMLVTWLTQLLEGLPLQFVQTLMVPRGWILSLNDALAFIRHHICVYEWYLLITIWQMCIYLNTFWQSWSPEDELCGSIMH